MKKSGITITLRKLGKSKTKSKSKMNSGVVAAPASLVLNGHDHQHPRHHGHSHSHGGGQPGGGKPSPSSSFSFCGADAKVACVALSVAALLSLAIAAANVFLAVRRARLVRRGENLEPASPRRAAGNGSEGMLSNSTNATLTARGASSGALAAAASLALAASHLVSSSNSSSSPDSKLYHFCFAATWATAAALCGVASSCRRAPRIRPVAWLSPLLYLVELVVVVVVTSSSSSPRFALYSALARLAVALGLAVSQAKRGLSAVDLEEDALATRALLAGPAGAGGGANSSSTSSSRRDVEAPAGPFSAPKTPSRGWISLLGVAIAFVWPEDPGHQVSKKGRGGERGLVGCCPKKKKTSKEKKTQKNRQN